jgi:hypothetical protein
VQSQHPFVDYFHFLSSHTIAHNFFELKSLCGLSFRCNKAFFAYPALLPSPPYNPKKAFRGQFSLCKELSGLNMSQPASSHASMGKIPSKYNNLL